MTVYIDNPRDYGWKYGPSCHLIADDEEELHAFAAQLGCRRKWFQPKSFPHYDLTIPRRREAVRLGAMKLSRRDMAKTMKRIRKENGKES